jgi:hypothetical protein
MARPKPVGFDNYRTFSFVSNDGSGFTFFRKASFSVEVSSQHRLYVGPSILSVAAASDAVITTDEPHGFHHGQTVVIHGMPDALATLLNGSHVIFAVTANSFKVTGDTTDADSNVTGGAFVVGKTYTIVTAGTTNFTLIGATSSAVGTVFKATGVGTGTGTALEGLSTLGVGIAGIDMEARIPVANYCIVPGDLCVGEHPEAWEMPLVG